MGHCRQIDAEVFGLQQSENCPLNPDQDDGGIGAPANAPLHEGHTLPTVIAYHDVKDVKHWLASPRRQELFGPLGVTNIRTFVDPQNPTRVGVMMDVPDMDAVMKAM